MINNIYVFLLMNWGPPRPRFLAKKIVRSNSTCTAAGKRQFKISKAH